MSNLPPLPHCRNVLVTHGSALTQESRFLTYVCKQIMHTDTHTKEIHLLIDLSEKKIIEHLQ